MSLKRSFTTGDLRVTVHLEQQILTCDTPGCDDEDEPAFAPTLNPALLADFVPAGVLLHKAKQFDDGLLASVELLIQRGAGKLPGKRWLLARWAEATARAREGGDAIEVLVAACRLAGVEAPVARRLEPAVVDRLQDFHAEPRRSMPLGLYTGSPELQRTFQQDRMLQTRLTDVAAIRRAAAALAAEPRLGAAYEAHLELAAALTARPTVADLRAISSRAIPRELALFPPADSPEAELVRDLGDELLDGDLLDELIRRVRAGRLDLAPGPRPGWYRETLASLTPLLTPGGAPEAARRRTTAEYDLYLEDLFRTAYALARETHVKDLEEEEEEEEGGDDEDAPVTVKITPKVTLDPLPTLYLRRANVYRALRKRLEGVLGPALADTARTMPSGQAGQAIGHELREMEKLFGAPRRPRGASWAFCPSARCRGGRATARRWHADSHGGAAASRATRTWRRTRA